MALGVTLAAPVVPVPAGGAMGHRSAVVEAVAAEAQYANVVAQIGGPYVHVVAVETNPTTDPHDFETSPSVAEAVAGASLVVQNGLGYDGYMEKIEAAAPTAGRRVLTVSQVLGLPSGTSNPHLWYRPATMPAVAAAVARSLGDLEPQERSYFSDRLLAFDRSLQPWQEALARLRARYYKTPVAVTEPVADDLLQAAGLIIKTPWALQADVMNGIDPPAQAINVESSLLSGHHVKAFLYNEQVVDPLTSSFLATARRAGVPVVAVYETMPRGFDYQRWMLAETDALARALAARRSTSRL